MCSDMSLHGVVSLSIAALKRVVRKGKGAFGMDFKQLRYFVAVVEEGTISAAAKKLFLTQPPLSTQIRLLEDELGCSLFQRGQRQITLTGAGKLLYEKATILLEMRQNARQEVTELAGAEAGTVRIGVVSSVICPMATGWIADFSREHPEVSFAITEANTYQLLDKLRANLLQIAIVRTPYAAEDMRARPIRMESLVAVGQRDLLDGDAPDISLEALSGMPVVLYRRWEPVLKDLFAASGLILREKCVCDDARTAMDLVTGGVGVGLVPESAALLAADSPVVCKRMQGGAIDSRIDLIRRADAALPACVSLFYDYIERRFPSQQAQREG